MANQLEMVTLKVVEKDRLGLHIRKRLGVGFQPEIFQALLL